MASRRWLPAQGPLHWRRRQRGDQAGLAEERGEAAPPGSKGIGRGVGPNPCDRGKMGVKESLLVEERGGPLSVCVAGANVNDHLLLAATLDAIVVERPAPTEEAPQHWCLDKGYDNAPSRQVTRERGYIAHIKRIGEEKKDEQGEKKYPARRWVVERTFSWLLRWRGILHRWDKKPENYLANLKLACALLWIRRAWNAGSTLLG